MANITTTVPNLIQGVNQQSPQVRLAGQCEEQINGLSTITNGLTKRPPARLIANIQAVAEEGDFVHFINRSATERYVVIIENRTNTGNNRGKMRVFNLADGTEASINAVSGGYTFNSDYLVNTSTADSHKVFKALSVGDSTFLLNTNTTVAKSTDLSQELDKTKALLFIKQGDYGKKYGIRFREPGDTATPASFTVTWNTVGSFGSLASYEIDAITVQNGGTGYEDDDVPTIEFPSEIVWDVRPEFDITIVNGTITSVTVVHPGRTEYLTSVTPPTSIEPSAPYEEVSITTGLSNSPNNSLDHITDTTAISRALTHALKSDIQDADHTSAEQTSQAVTDDFTSIDHQGSIVITKDEDGDFYLEAFDGLAGAGLGLVHKEVDALSDLPVRAPDGFRVAVRGDANANEDDYYLRFETNDGQAFGDGGWVEDIGPGIETSFDQSTLPLQLINTGINTFTLDTTNWSLRKTGDDETNPFPSFVGKTLNNFVFFKNRLGFIYEDSVVLSEAGELFNFFRTTVRTLLDTAPIDVTSATANVTNLRSSVAFQESLLLFGDRGQFVLKGAPLTNETVTLDAVTNYEVSAEQTPLNVGSYVYFPFNRGDFIGLHEYSLNATTDVYDSQEITSQVPSYIKKGSYLKMTGSTSNDLIALTTGGKDVYIYKYFFNGREKVVSSWSKFTFAFDVISLEFMESSLFVLGKQGLNTVLTELKCQDNLSEIDTTDGYTVHLDLLKKHESIGGPTPDPSAPRSYNLGFTPNSGDVIEFYDLDGAKLEVVSVTGDTAFVVSYNKRCFSGIRYDLEYTFSEPVFKQGNPPVSSGLARMILRNGTLFFTHALDFKIEVTPYKRDVRTFNFTPEDTSTNLAFDDGKFRFSIFTSASDTLIKIVNSSAFASNFQACEFEANVHTRSTRI